MRRTPTVRLMRSSTLVAVLVCAACASHHEHLPPQELLKANIEAMQEVVPSKISDPARAARVNQAIDELRQQLVSFEAVQATYQSNIRAPERACGCHAVGVQHLRGVVREAANHIP